MNYAEREEIFSKEVLSLDDIMKLFGIAKSTASQKIKQIKRQLGKDRLGMEGKIHILDYFEWCGIDQVAIADRYKKAPIDHSIDKTGFFKSGSFL